MLTVYVYGCFLFQMSLDHNKVTELEETNSRLMQEKQELDDKVRVWQVYGWQVSIPWFGLESEICIQIH